MDDAGASLPVILDLEINCAEPSVILESDWFTDYFFFYLLSTFIWGLTTLSVMNNHRTCFSDLLI
jgi:hypothetical protein